MISRILHAIPSRAALVVGDICLDRWCTYDPAASEPSRETGIARIGVVSTELTPGAGGTVANNLAALGVGRVAVLGVIGDDGHGAELVRALQLRNIGTELLVETPSIATFTYTKLINAATGAEDQPRIDFINAKPLGQDVSEKLLTKLRYSAGAFDVIFIADQAEAEQGVVDANIREYLSALAKDDPRKVIWVDSRRRPELFRHAIVKPNRQEAEEACQRLFGKIDYERLRRHIDTRLLLVTHGDEGVLLVEQGRQAWIKTKPNPAPVDICGAGDSFSAGAAMAYEITASAEEAARFGNIVASITITKKGTGTATPEEVLAASREIPR
jgi:rfaE bifunctional protein kinase chain/domain